jgi:serine/threonine-protein kinase HipA
MRRPKHAPLTVALNGRRVGRLNRQSSGAVDFTYDAEWLEWEHALAVSLSLPLREDRYIGAPVLAVFENLLPDNEVIRRRLAERLGAEGEDAYSLLSVIGRDCVGALQFLPEGEAPIVPGAPGGEPLTDAAIGDIIANLATAPLGLEEGRDFRISLAGAQEKTALLRKEGQWLRPQGASPTTHILKPQIGRTDGGVDLSQSVENEYLCLKLTRALGAPSADVEIKDFAGRRVLVVERFDRHWTEGGRLLRIPQEDFCQALGEPPSRRYQSSGGPGPAAILRLLQGSDTPLDDQLTFLRTLVIFWLLGATDGHAKNFSLHLSPAGRYRLAPLYDVISLQPSVDAKQIRHNRYKLSMAVGAARHYVMGDIAPRHFIETATAGGIGEAPARAMLKALADDAPAALEAVVAGLPKGFPEAVVESIVGGAASRLEMIRAALGAWAPA